MRYLAKGKWNRHFELFSMHEESLGTVDKVTWYSCQAVITLTGGVAYSITYSGMMRNIANLSNGERHICSMKPGWNGVEVVMDNGGAYKLKRKGLFGHSFMLLTEQGHEVVTIRKNFKFSEMSFTYEILTDDNYQIGMAPEMILLMISVIANIQQGAAAM